MDSYKDFATYLWKVVSQPGLYDNYFYSLILVSLFFFLIEWLNPWRKDQPKFRKDFWMDCFYMFFNFFLFWLIIYNAASSVVVDLFNTGIKSLTGYDLQGNNPMNSWSMWAILFTGFLVRDFVQWWTHRLLHRSAFLWEFHKVHHSVEQMGFAAHLRYHWMETVVYRMIEYIPLALLGIDLYDFFLIHIFTLAVGHYNHSNISISPKITGAIVSTLIGLSIAFGAFEINLLNDPVLLVQVSTVGIAILLGYFVLGPVMPYLFNSPEMHIWHHAYEIPEDRSGVNFALTLAIWDYIFKTAYIPYNGRDIRLGFPGIEKYPKKFLPQILHGISPNKKE